ncbi:MAG: helix-hairpin-helix domain-containing protein [Acidobacteria bacterium]|nr:helix-hairpin-helix domain-containing protein [Acidobacteriota bacterium]
MRKLWPAPLKWWLMKVPLISKIAWFGAMLTAALTAQNLPDAPGRAEVERMCRGCHEVARSVSLRQDRAGWATTFAKMSAFGMKSTPQESELVMDYLAKYYPADEVPPVNVNKATAIQLESGLSLKRSQAAAVVAHRTRNGPFKTIDDLKKVPNIEPDKFDAKKDRIVF